MVSTADNRPWKEGTRSKPRGSRPRIESIPDSQAFTYLADTSVLEYWSITLDMVSMELAPIDLHQSMGANVLNRVKLFEGLVADIPWRYADLRKRIDPPVSVEIGIETRLTTLRQFLHNAGTTMDLKMTQTGWRGQKYGLLRSQPGSDLPVIDGPINDQTRSNVALAYPETKRKPSQWTISIIAVVCVVLAACVGLQVAAFVQSGNATGSVMDADFKNVLQQSLMSLFTLFNLLAPLFVDKQLQHRIDSGAGPSLGLRSFALSLRWFSSLR